jgi:putative DNA primase/helicase
MVDGRIGATHVVWEGVIDGTALEILGSVEYEEDGSGGERQDAEQFLRDVLSDGPASTK